MHTQPYQTILKFAVLTLATFFIHFSLAAESPLPNANIELSEVSDEQNVIILYKDKKAKENGKKAIKELKGKIISEFKIIPAIAAKVTKTAKAELLKDKNIKKIEMDGRVKAHDFSSLWGPQRIYAPEAQSDFGAYGQGVKVAILDSGLNYNHSEFHNLNYAGGYDFVNNDTDPMDDDGHGTHVAGTIAASLTDNSGVGGIAPNVELYALKVLDENGSGYFSDIIAAIDWCVLNEIQITNNSYGSSQDPGSALQQAYINATAAGVLFIASAGNEGRRNGRGNNVGYPARYDSVMAVAATTQSDSRASFSSTGPAVEIAAPGAGILSTVLGNSYATWNGTSMACPHVVGAAALILQKLGTATPAALRNYMTSTAEDLGDAGLDPHFGHGLINVYAALNSLPGNETPINQTTEFTKDSEDK